MSVQSWYYCLGAQAGQWNQTAFHGAERFNGQSSGSSQNEKAGGWGVLLVQQSYTCHLGTCHLDMPCFWGRTQNLFSEWFPWNSKPCSFAKAAWLGIFALNKEPERSGAEVDDTRSPENPRCQVPELRSNKLGRDAFAALRPAKASSLVWGFELCLPHVEWSNFAFDLFQSYFNLKLCWFYPRVCY